MRGSAVLPSYRAISARQCNKKVLTGSVGILYIVWRMGTLDRCETGRTTAFLHRTPDAEIWEDGDDLRTIERQAYREASEKCMRLHNAMLAHIGRRLLGTCPDITDVLVDYWTVCYAEGSFLCNGVPMNERCHRLGVEKQTLSRAVVQYTVGHGLPPSEFMRDPETMENYMTARLRAIEKENEKHATK